jgi:hypothetical protein
MNAPLSIPLKLHLFSALLAPRQLDLAPSISPIHQLRQRFPHQLAPALARFRFDLSKTRLRMGIVPVFQLLVHLLRFFQKCRLAAGT